MLKQEFLKGKLRIDLTATVQIISRHLPPDPVFAAVDLETLLGDRGGNDEDGFAPPGSGSGGEESGDEVDLAGGTTNINQDSVDDGGDGVGGVGHGADIRLLLTRRIC